MDQIILQNFRCFREEQTARLAPLTLLVGENSTGKTSLLAMIRALWEVAHRLRVPDFKEDPYDLGSFDEITHNRRGKTGGTDTFEAGFNFARSKGKGEGSGGLLFKVAFGKTGNTPVPVSRLLRDCDRKVWVEVRLGSDGSWVYEFGTPNGHWKAIEVAGLVIGATDEDNLMALSFLTDLVFHNLEGGGGLFQISPLEGPEQPNAADRELIRQMCRSEFVFYQEPIYASAPVRSKPRRTYDPSRRSRDPEGDYIPMYLANVFARDKVQWRNLKKTLELFGDTAGLFSELSVTPLGKTPSGPFQLQIRRFDQKSKGPRRNLIDVGYGVSQVLPLITELLRNDAAPMVLLQQPEVHLHPSAQASLGTLFCEVADRNRQIIVETHSDHLLDRVRMDVRDRKTELKAEDVSILYFERGDLDVRIHSLRLDQEGNILDQPQSYRRFFMQEANRSIGL